MNVKQIKWLAWLFLGTTACFATEEATTSLDTPIMQYFDQLAREQRAEKKQAEDAAIKAEPPLELVDPQKVAPHPLEPFSGDRKRDAAYQKLLESSLPLSPDQMMYLRKLQDVTQQAVATTPNPPPTPLSSTQVISLEPGATPPVIRLSAGFVTSLVFVDVTGSPWPLTAYGLGDPTSFNIQWDNNSNALFIQGMKNYAHGNLAVRLKDLNTPIMISLIAGQRQVDYRVDLQVAGRGPNAAPPIVTQTYSDPNINSTLINLLDGIPPEGSRRLDISPVYGQAWLHHKHIYFRTQLQVLSPAWRATVSAPDGTRVYEMIQTPVILASQDGKTISVQLKGL